MPASDSPQRTDLLLEEPAQEAHYTSPGRREEFRAAFANAAESHVLVLPRCGLSVVPRSALLPDLTELTLDCNALVSLPADIGGLRALTRLTVCWNALEALPPELGQLRALRVLDVSFNKLTTLPDEVGALDSLVELTASDNQIASLPASLGTGCRALR